MCYCTEKSDQVLLQSIQETGDSRVIWTGYPVVHGLDKNFHSFSVLITQLGADGSCRGYFSVEFFYFNYIYIVIYKANTVFSIYGNNKVFVKNFKGIKNSVLNMIKSIKVIPE